jgi:hypothetical protein
MRDDDGDAQHRDRVEQRLLDLLLQRLGLFLVGRDLVEQRLERARLLAGLDQIDEQIVEVQRNFASDSCSVLPPSMFALMSSTSFCIAGFSCPLPMISKACTIGMPADIMVASWRLNTAISSFVTLPPREKAVALGLDARRGHALAAQVGAQAASFAASDLPRTLLPRLSLPSQRNWVSFLPAVADTAINRSLR